jgi:hypothetical protein
MRCRVLAAIGLVLTIPVGRPPVRAQYTPQTNPESLPNQYPPPLPARRGPAPKIAFALAGEVALPGPLADGAPWVADGAMFVPVAEGVARVAPTPGATPEIVPSATTPDGDGWVVAPGGTRRFRATAEGLVECEKRSSARKRWKRDWRIVAPNATLAPPLVVGPRLCYPGLDDRVTCVRASNGHRLWSVDLGDRLSRAIAAWPPLAATPGRATRSDRSVEGEVLLVVPDDGASLIALDAYDGTRLTSYDLPAAKNVFKSAPFVFAEGRIAVVRKGYKTDEAAVTLLDLVAVQEAKPAGPLPYTSPSPTPASPARR